MFTNTDWLIQLAFLFPAAVYFLMMAIAGITWKLMSAPGSLKSAEAFTIIVAARNEEKNVSGLLRAVIPGITSGNNRVIIADDRSEDNTAAVVEGYAAHHPGVVLIKTDGSQAISPKQHALLEALSQADTDKILVTDADCVPADGWTEVMSSALGRDKYFVAGPVKLTGEGMLEGLQIVENIALMTFNAASFRLGLPLMASGANMAFSKEKFEAAGAFNASRAASGDDILLLHSISKKYGKGKVTWLKDRKAIVETTTQTSWREILNQRVRWAAKNKVYRNAFSWISGSVIMLNILLIPVWMLLILVSDDLQMVALTALALKLLADLFIFLSASGFFGQSRWWWMTIAGQPILFLLYIQVFIRALRGGFEWKGRTFKI